jgi:flagellar FliL protein
MPAVAAEPASPEIVAPVKAGSKKKLMLIGAAVLLVLLLLAAGALLYLKNKAAHAALDAADEEVAGAANAKADPAHPPTFLPLEPFVVNLADKDADRYGQIGIVLEVDSALFADQMKAYMPAIRNAILMILAHKTSHELLERSGKEQLAAEILRETVRPMGIDIAAPEPVQDKAEAAEAEPGKDDAVEARPKPAARKRSNVHNPVRHVHFSNFIIQ